MAMYKCVYFSVYRGMQVAGTWIFFAAGCVFWWQPVVSKHWSDVWTLSLIDTRDCDWLAAGCMCELQTCRISQSEISSTSVLSERFVNCFQHDIQDRGTTKGDDEEEIETIKLFLRWRRAVLFCLWCWLPVRMFNKVIWSHACYHSGPLWIDCPNS